MNVIKRSKFTTVFVIILAILITCTTSSFYNSNLANAYTNTRSYFKYDASDGGYYGFYTLPDTNMNQIQSVIGTDSRTTNEFNNGVVKLIGSNNYLGTGFIVDHHVIATAAHCVYKSDYESEIIEDILVFDSNNTVSNHLTPVEVHIPCQFITYKDNNDDQAAKNYDYALITVEESLPTNLYTYFNLSTCFNNVSLSSNSVKVTGFPQIIGNMQVNSKTVHAQYTGLGNLQTKTTYRLFHDVDTSGGNSGGPVYIEETINGTTCYTVLAIHTCGLDGNDLVDTNNNCGTRVTTDIMKFYMSNPYLGY